MRADATATAAGRAPALREAAWLLGATLALSLCWSLPAAPAALTPAALLVVAGEIAVLLALLALLPPLRRGGLGRILRYAVGLATGGVVLLSGAELLIRSILARPLNPLLDLHLASALMHLLTGTLGGALGWLSLVGLAALPLVVALLGGQAAGVAQRLLQQRRWRHAVLVGAALVGVALAAQQAWPAASRATRWWPSAPAGPWPRNGAAASELTVAVEHLRGGGARRSVRGSPRRHAAGPARRRRRPADVRRILRPQRARAAALCRYAAAAPRRGRRGSGRGRPVGRVGLPDVADGRRPVLARPRHAATAGSGSTSRCSTTC